MVTARSMVAKSKVAQTRFCHVRSLRDFAGEVTCLRTRAGAPHALRRNARATGARSLRNQRCTLLIPVAQATRSVRSVRRITSSAAKATRSKRSVRRITSSAAKPRRQPIDVARPCLSHLANDPMLASAASSRRSLSPLPDHLHDASRAFCTSRRKAQSLTRATNRAVAARNLT